MRGFQCLALNRPQIHIKSLISTHTHTHRHTHTHIKSPDMHSIVSLRIFRPNKVSANLPPLWIRVDTEINSFLDFFCRKIIFLFPSQTNPDVCRLLEYQTHFFMLYAVLGPGTGRKPGEQIGRGENILGRASCNL